MDDPDQQAPNVIIENVHVRYTVNTNDPKNRAKGLRQKVSAAMGRQPQTTVRALRGVNFVAREGEMVGIVGSNGSGKSTFLRNIAGVEQPDRGRILVRYQPLLLGVSAALQPALSGSENVRLGCLAMGFSPDEADEAFDQVVELSALGSAIHRPMGTYSSGMGARLRFAIALVARPRILLIDEALSTGDATFAQRSEQAMSDLLGDAGTVLLVNHAAKTIQELCDRAVWMHRGEIIMNGPAEAVAEKYRWWAWNAAQDKQDVAEKLLHDVVSNATKDEINILEPELVRHPIPRHAVRPGSKRVTGARHLNRRRSETDQVVEGGTSSAMLGSAEFQVWPETFDSTIPKAKFPISPKPASLAAGGRKFNEAPPALRLNPSKKRVVLRAANPDDRASSVAASEDITGRRLASISRRTVIRQHEERSQNPRPSGLGENAEGPGK